MKTKKKEIENLLFEILNQSVYVRKISEVLGIKMEQLESPYNEVYCGYFKKRSDRVTIPVRQLEMMSYILNQNKEILKQASKMLGIDTFDTKHLEGKEINIAIALMQRATDILTKVNLQEKSL